MINSNKRYFPNVKIDNNHVYYEIKDWLDVNEYEVNRFMRIIFDRLGYTEDDFIIINSCYLDDDLNKYLEFEVNGLDTKRIRIFNDIENNYPCIKLERDGNKREFYYQVIISGMNNIDLNMYKYGDIINDRIYNYELSKEWVEYRLEDGEYSLEFRVSKPSSRISEFGGYRKYEIDNQKEFIKYLVNLDFSKSMLDVYKDICEISIGNDMSKYNLIDLRLSRYVCDNNGVIENRLTDMFHFEDGKLVSLIISKDNKQIWYDGNTDCASYIYDSDLMQLNITEYTKNMSNCINERLNCKSDEIINVNIIDDARNEINSVKKLVLNINGNRNL